METGTKVWIKHEADVWAPGTIIDHSIENHTVDVELLDNTVKHNVIVSDETILHQNDEKNSSCDNLVSLTHLHEPAVLHSLSSRYNSDQIYTQIGEILLAVNPFKALPALYHTETLNKYKESSNINDETTVLPPHAYMVAKDAYSSLVAKSKSQSILVSGESGAGKTETTKIMMRFLANIAGNKTTSSNAKKSIEGRVLQSNPILEAFGNAKTIRNDNSSRFGKFIEIRFNEENTISGAKIKTYLLEKVRLCKAGKNERNFHIFYQLLAGNNNITDFGLSDKTFVLAKKFKKSDKTEFQNTISAMTDIGITNNQQTSILKIIAAILHLGNIEFIDTGDDTCEIKNESLEYVSNASTLLSIPTETLVSTLLSRTIHAGKDTVVVKMSRADARSARNALAMALYGNTFSYLVSRINASIRDSSKSSSFIGLLDIFGFEDFKSNSFEQLCINYANEALQQQFNSYVFTQEQRIYTTEGIDWTYIDFPDNAPVITLFETKPLGIFSLLDQECLMPKGTDAGMASKFYQNLKLEAFSASPLEQKASKFCVVHYAGKVCYNTKGFLVKNKDRVPEESLQLFKASANHIVKKFQDLKEEDSEEDDSEEDDSDSEDEEERGGKNRRLRKRYSSMAARSVGTQFKAQLATLLDTIEDTTPHYIRCLKPNDDNKPLVLNRPRLLEQLRSGGVLEAIKVARAGYAIRLGHSEFTKMYQPLFKTAATNNSTMSLKTLVNKCKAQNNLEIEIGKTKVFFKKSSFEKLESWRHSKRRDAAVLLQAKYKSHVARTQFLSFKSAITSLQQLVRCFAARTLVRKLRQERAALVITLVTKTYVARQKFARTKRHIITIQCLVRANAAKIRVQTLRRQYASIVIQSRIRGYHAKKEFKHTIQSVIKIQCLVRVKAAKKLGLILKKEARDVNNLQSENQRLLNELKALKEAMSNNTSTTVKQETDNNIIVKEEHQSVEEEQDNDNQERDLCSTSTLPAFEEVVDTPETTLDSLSSDENDKESSPTLQAVEEMISNAKRNKNNNSMRNQRITSSSRHTISNLSSIDANTALENESSFGKLQGSNNSNSGYAERFLRKESLASDAGKYRTRALSSNMSGVSVSTLARWNKDTSCKECACAFNFFTRRHHCRTCGNSFCHEHSTRRIALPAAGYPTPVRVCDDCFENEMICNNQNQNADLSSLAVNHTTSIEL